MKKNLSVAYLVAIFGILYIPILTLIFFSFNSANSTAVFDGFSFRWYRELFNSPDTFTALRNTLILAIDYSEHDDAKIYMATEKTVYLNKKTYRDAQCLDGKPLRRLISKDGTLDGVVVTLRRHESALIRLI